MGDFLVGHELDEEAVISVEPGRLELGDRELGESIFEKIEFDVLLVQC